MTQENTNTNTNNNGMKGINEEMRRFALDCLFRRCIQ